MSVIPQTPQSLRGWGGGGFVPLNPLLDLLRSPDPSPTHAPSNPKSWIRPWQLKFSLYRNCQNRPCGKEFNITAFVNLLICNVNVTIILWRNLNIVFMKLFPEWLTSLSTSIQLKYCVIKRISHYSIDAPGQLLNVSSK